MHHEKLNVEKDESGPEKLISSFALSRVEKPSNWDHLLPYARQPTRAVLRIIAGVLD